MQHTLDNIRVLLLAGLDCDILIHEATMEDDLVEDAIEKRHR